MSQLCRPQAITELKQQAIDWLVLLRSDDMDDSDLLVFADWLAEDHAHSDAFSEAEALFEKMTLVATFEDKASLNETELDEVPKVVSIKQQRSKNYFSRWLEVSSTLAIAASLFFIITTFLPHKIYLFDRFTSDYYTQAGELSGVQLSDGSHMLLNTHSAVSVAYSESIRKITLHHGQVRFTVAKETRPFVVESSHMLIRALGTIFQVYKIEKDSIKVIVQEHSVSVSEINDVRVNNGVTVEKGQQLLHQLGHDILEPEKVDLKQETAWQLQRLIIKDRPLIELITEIERYSNRTIFISDEKLKNMRVTGVFSLKDPDAILGTVCKALNLTETRLLGGWSVVQR